MAWLLALTNRTALVTSVQTAKSRKAGTMVALMKTAFTASAAAVTAALYPSQRGSTALLWAVLRNRFVKFSNVRPPSAVRSRPRYRSKAVKTSQTNGMRNSAPIRASFPSA